TSTPLSLILFFFSSYAHHRDLHSFPTRRSSDLVENNIKTSTNIYTFNCLSLLPLIDLILVLPPPFNVSSSGLLVIHAPLVKSGNSTTFPFFTDSILKGTIALHAAASYTS